MAGEGSPSNTVMVVLWKKVLKKMGTSYTKLPSINFEQSVNAAVIKEQ